MRTLVCVAVAVGLGAGVAAAEPEGKDGKVGKVGKVETRGSEVIEIEGRTPPAVPPKPKQRRRLAPPYSDNAIETNAWEIAWLLLDIDRHGKVARLKFLHRPGHDLIRIAVETGLALTFEPARDADGGTIRTYALWALEWPSYWWMVARTGFSTAIPVAVNAQRCEGDGPLNLDYHYPALRNCSTPDFSAANQQREPWLDEVGDADALVAETAKRE